MFFKIQRFIEKNIFPHLCILLSYFKFLFRSGSKIDQKNVKSVVFIRLWALGESILALPAIHSLKQTNPDLKITVLCTNRNKDVFLNHDFIDNVEVASFSYLLKNFIFGFLGFRWFKKFDLAIDTEPHFAISAIASFFIAKRSIGYNCGNRSRLYDVTVNYDDSSHTVFTICNLLSPLNLFPKPKYLIPLKYSQSDEKIASDLISSFNSKTDRFIGFHAFCGPTASTRAWPKENFASLIDLILSSFPNLKIVLTGSPNETSSIQALFEKIKNPQKNQRVKIATHLSSGSLFALLEKLNLFVSNDTGPMHASAAMGTYTIGLFGPETPRRYGPFPLEKNFAFYKAEHPPVINVHLNQFGSKSCDGECLRAITVDEVFSKIKERLSQ
jgi:heptosyltransferase-2